MALLASLLALLLSASESPFIQREGTLLYEGTRPFRYLGVNVFWLLAEASYSDAGRANVRTVLDEAASLGASVVRTWGFADGPLKPHLQPTAGVFDDDVFEALDFVVEEARQRGLRLLLPLLNYWSEYGGIRAYEVWREGESESTWTPYDDCPRFYTAPTSRRHYQEMVRTVTGHVSSLSGLALRDDPTIMGWELCNECRCRGAGRAAELNSWVTAMAEFVKGEAPRQLIGTGTEGFYRPVDGVLSEDEADALNPTDWYQHEGVDFIRGHSSPALDFASYHLHWSDWMVNSSGVSRERPGGQPAFVREFMERHAAHAAEVLRRPLLLTEFSSVATDVQTPTDAASDAASPDEVRSENSRNAMYALALQKVGQSAVHAALFPWQLTLSVDHLCCSPKSIVVGRPEDQTIVAALRMHAATMRLAAAELPPRTLSPPFPPSPPSPPSLPGSGLSADRGDPGGCEASWVAQRLRAEVQGLRSGLSDLESEKAELNAQVETLRGKLSASESQAAHTAEGPHSVVALEAAALRKEVEGLRLRLALALGEAGGGTSPISPVQAQPSATPATTRSVARPKPTPTPAAAADDPKRPPTGGWEEALTSARGEGGAPLVSPAAAPTQAQIPHPNHPPCQVDGGHFLCVGRRARWHLVALTPPSYDSSIGIRGGKGCASARLPTRARLNAASSAVRRRPLVTLSGLARRVYSLAL